MAKHGKSLHTKRLNAGKAIAIHDKKEHKFIITPLPGKHPKDFSIPLGVFLRDIIGVAKTLREAKKIIKSGEVFIDGRKVNDEKLPLGLMDVVSFPRIGLNYRITVNDDGKLIPKETKNPTLKLGKVINKYTYKKSQLKATLHDGRNLNIDNNVKVGDSLLIEIPSQKLLKLIKLQPGAKCLITRGKHAGTVGTLKEIIKRGEGKKDEAVIINSKDGSEFVTILNYVMAIDNFEG